MNIGFDNRVPYWKVAAILSPKGAPAKRLRDEAYKKGGLLVATCGRLARSMVITDSNQVILSMVAPETLMARLNEARREEAAHAQRD